MKMEEIKKAIEELTDSEKREFFPKSFLKSVTSRSLEKVAE